MAVLARVAAFIALPIGGSENPIDKALPAY
jgi:hypothetical protein